MTREKERAVMALDKTMPRLVRSLIKPYRFKAIGGMVWTVRGEVLFILTPWLITPPGDDRAYLKTSCEVKPLFMDDLLWDILGFQENKSAPMSPRVNGAFALPGVPVYEKRKPLEVIDSEQVTTLLSEELERFSGFLPSVEGREMTWFREWEAQQENYGRMELWRLLLALHDGKRDEVLAYVTTHRISDYGVGNRTVGELMAEYCI